MSDPYAFGVNYPPTAPVAIIATQKLPGRLGQPAGTTYGRTAKRRT